MKMIQGGSIQLNSQSNDVKRSNRQKLNDTALIKLNKEISKSKDKDKEIDKRKEKANANDAKEINEKIVVTDMNTQNTKIDFIAADNNKSNSNANKQLKDIDLHIHTPIIEKCFSSKHIHESIDKIIHQTLHNTLQDHLTSPNSQRQNTDFMLMKRNLKKNKISQDRIIEVKHLKNKEDSIKKILFTLNQKKQLLESESYLNVENNLIDKNIQSSQLKNIRDHKTSLYKKLDQIATQIDDIMVYENLKAKPNKAQLFLKEHMTSVNSDYIKKKHEYEQQSMIYKQNRLNSISNDKRVKELEMMEKHNKELKEQFLINHKEKEREVNKKRKEVIDSHMEKAKKYINEQFKKKESDYLYYSNREQYNRREKKRIEKIKMDQKTQLVSKEEWENVAKEMKKHHLVLLQEAKDKQDLLKEMWRNRSQSLPSFESKFQERVDYERIKQQEEEENKRLYRSIHAKEGINYGRDNITQPKPNVKLKRDREAAIIRLTLKKKPLQYAKIQIRKEAIYRPPLIQTPKHKKAKSVISATMESEHEKVIKPHNYLDDLKNKREKNNIPIIKYNWKKILNNDKGSLAENIKQVKFETKSIDQRIHDNIKLLHVTGGYSNKPELGNEISELLFDSIKGKLMIMDKIKSSDYCD